MHGLGGRGEREREKRKQSKSTECYNGLLDIRTRSALGAELTQAPLSFLDSFSEQTLILFLGSTKRNFHFVLILKSFCLFSSSLLLLLLLLHSFLSLTRTIVSSRIFKIICASFSWLVGASIVVIVYMLITHTHTHTHKLQVFNKNSHLQRWDALNAY